MPSFTITTSPQRLTIQTAELELGFAIDDGGLRWLRRRSGPNLLGYGSVRPLIDVQVGLDSAWIAERLLVRYLRHSVTEADGGVTIAIVSGVGPLVVTERYRVTGTLIVRQVTIRNVSEEEILLRRVRLVVPWVRLGDAELCRFEAPGNTVRPRVPLAVAAAQRRDVLPRRFFAPGLRDGRAIELAPTAAPGLLALHEPQLAETLLCWFSGDHALAQPLVEGNGTAVCLLHELALAHRLRPDAEADGGAQVLLLTREPWPEALPVYRRTQTLLGGPAALAPPGWLSSTVLCEADAAEFGGYVGLAAVLPRLQAAGAETICLRTPFSSAAAPLSRWPALSSFAELDPTLGSAAELRALVDTAHASGMRVLLDLPLAGCGPGAALLAEHPEWFCHDETGALARVPSDPTLIAFDWDNRALRAAALDAVDALCAAADLDGVRAILPPAAPPNWANPAQVTIGSGALTTLLTELRARLANTRPDTAVLCNLGGPAPSAVCAAAHDDAAHLMLFHLALNRMTPAELGEWLHDHLATLNGGLRIGFVEHTQTWWLNPVADGMHGSRISRMLLTGVILCGFVPLLTAAQLLTDGDTIGPLLAARSRYPALQAGPVSFATVACNAPQVFALARSAGTTWLIGLLHVSALPKSVTIGLPIDTLAIPEGVFAIRDLLTGELLVDGLHRNELAAVTVWLGAYAARLLEVVAA